MESSRAVTIMSSISTWPDWAHALLAAFSGATAAFLGLRRRYSKDSSEIASDKAQTQLIATLMAERDSALVQAKEAWAQRLEDAIKIAKWEALMEASNKETERLRSEIFAMRLHTRKLTAIILRLDPAAASILGLTNGDGISEPTVTGEGTRHAVD